MRCHAILLLSLVAVDDVPKGDNAIDRARRAAIVDRIMGEPTAPRSPRFRIDQPPSTEPIETEVENGDDDEEDDPGKPIRVAVRLEQANFDCWLFGDKGDEQSRRLWLDYRLKTKVEQVVSKNGFSPEQAKKLQLAGQGDIKRFFDRVEELRAKFDEIRANIQAGQLFLSNNLRPLRAEFQAGSFGNDSLFNKTLEKMRNDARMAGTEAK